MKQATPFDDQSAALVKPDRIACAVHRVDRIGIVRTDTMGDDNAQIATISQRRGDWFTSTPRDARTQRFVLRGASAPGLHYRSVSVCVREMKPTEAS